MFNYGKHNRSLFTIDINDMRIIKEFVAKIKLNQLYQQINNLTTNGEVIQLIDKNIIASIKTIEAIKKHHFVIFSKSGELHLNQENPKILFQILSNNYLHNPSKLAFLNFIANYANTDGFLNILETQLHLSGMNKNGTLIEIFDRMLIIDLNNYPEEVPNKKYFIAQPVQIIEYFKLRSIKMDDTTEVVSATLGLLSTLELHGETPEFTVNNMFICTDLLAARKIAYILEDNYQMEQEINSVGKILDIFGVNITYPLFFSLKQRPAKLSQEDNQRSEGDMLSNYFSKLRLC